MTQRDDITLVVDGVEVRAPDGTMLVDAAKAGDVEIPVFCYEPKLGQPVGACRMCLVEVEGIPKLQTACSTPIRDGMVVYTQTDRVQEAQGAVVEFLLVNHPLDCPVCDKGGECPLQDISMGWGPGKSRFTDPKRHFRKPIPLSPLVKIDRERCILCYRCVRFSQEVAEDEQLQLLERSAATYVGTFDDRPYIAPFHGNVIELCPVGALTSDAYRFRARPWDIEDAGSVCTLCPSQCNVKFTVRDERVQRALARDNAEVDDGWLCDKGRFGFQMIDDPERITEPMVRAGGELRPASWEEALDAAAQGLRAAGEHSATIVGGTSSNEEGYLAQRISRRSLGSPNVDSRSSGAGLDRELALALSDPALGAKVSDLDGAEAILLVGCDPMHSMPILDLRVRKAVRRAGARLAIASERPTALDGGAEEAARYAPGEAASFLGAVAAALGAEGFDASQGGPAELAAALRPGKTVILWGERIGHGRRGPEALRALLACARALKLGEADGCGLIEIPDAANARGLRETGCLPDAGPGFVEVAPGRDAGAIREALEARELDAALLVNADPIRDDSGDGGWQLALTNARFVVAVAMFQNASAKHANVVFPAESHAEKEGTVTHPDGRLQRLRRNVPHRDATRSGWQVLAELAARLGDETGIDSAPEALATIAAEVPFYGGITLEEIGGRGIRWQEREAASALPRLVEASDAPSGSASSRSAEPDSADRTALVEASPEETSDASPDDARLRLGTFRDLWAAEVTDHSPALRFLAPEQTFEIASADAERLGLTDGEQVEVSSNGTAVLARLAVRERLRPGSAFLIEGTAQNAANALAGAGTVEVKRIAPERPASGREAEEAGR